MALNFANNNSLSAITSKPSGLSGGSMNLISTQTASSSSTISFTSGIDSTYDEYVFKFINIHPATDNTKLTFNGSIDSGSNYNVTKTSTAFYSYHAENDGGQGLGYYSSEDLAQGTGFQPLIVASGNANDECGSGYLHLFNPSSTTFVKHFISRGNAYSGDYSQEVYVGGYMNTTSAIDAVQFKMSSGNIDSGVIKLYGIS